MSRFHSRAKSFGYAFNGIKIALKQEPNLKIHLALALIALTSAYFLSFTLAEWALLVLTIALVLILELINTAIEAMTNILSPEKREAARVAKDVSAAAVLTSAITALVVGALLFLPKLVTLFY